MINITDIAVPTTNDNIMGLRVGTKGISSTRADMLSPSNLEEVHVTAEPTTNSTTIYSKNGSGAITTEIITGHTFSVKFKMLYSSTDEVAKFCAGTATKTGINATTQVEAKLFTGQWLSFVGNIKCSQIGVDGAPQDNAEFEVELTNATGDLLISETDPAEEVV